MFNGVSTLQAEALNNPAQVLEMVQLWQSCTCIVSVKQIKDSSDIASEAGSPISSLLHAVKLHAGKRFSILAVLMLWEQPETPQ